MPLPTPIQYQARPPTVWAIQITQEGLASAGDVKDNEQYQDALSTARLRFLGAKPDGGRLRIEFDLDGERPVSLVGDLGDYLVSSDGSLRLVPEAEFEAAYQPVTPQPPGDGTAPAEEAAK